jgi:hypothetical protein
MVSRMTFQVLALIGGTLLCAGAARAESVDSDCCGPLDYHVEQNGDIFGLYPKQSGRIEGSVARDGSAIGLWFQPRSDHPCTKSQGGTLAWGHFVIRHVAMPEMSGEWGYCEEVPTRKWGFH